MDAIRFGAAYYAEYQRTPDIERDFDLMAKAGFATTAPTGTGRVTVIATVPDQTMAADLARWLVPEPGHGLATDDSVTVATSTDAAGRRLHVLHHWGWGTASATAAVPLTDLLTGKTHAAGEPVTLEAWDVRVLRSEPGQARDSRPGAW